MAEPGYVDSWKPSPLELISALVAMVRRLLNHQPVHAVAGLPLADSLPATPSTFHLEMAAAAARPRILR